MAITVEEYRLRIGHFNCEYLRNKKVQGETKISFKSKIKVSSIILLLSSIVLFYPKESLTSELERSYKTELLYKISSSTYHSHESTITAVHTSSHSWSYLGMSINKLQCIINGNRRALGYKLAVWNCGRGLVSGDSAGSKFQDIKLNFRAKSPHVMGVIETDIHGIKSNVRRVYKHTTTTLKTVLDIPGYSLVLPLTCEAHGQARLLVWVSNDIKYKVKALTNSHDDLPSISLEIGLGRASKTLVNYYYRE